MNCSPGRADGPVRIRTRSLQGRREEAETVTVQSRIATHPHFSCNDRKAAVWATGVILLVKARGLDPPSGTTGRPPPPIEGPDRIRKEDDSGRKKRQNQEDRS
jgi:hypothetical protein